MRRPYPSSKTSMRPEAVTSRSFARLLMQSRSSSDTLIVAVISTLCQSVFHSIYDSCLPGTDGAVHLPTGGICTIRESALVCTLNRNARLPDNKPASCMNASFGR